MNRYVWVAGLMFIVSGLGCAPDPASKSSEGLELDSAVNADAPDNTGDGVGSGDADGVDVGSVDGAQWPTDIGPDGKNHDGAGIDVVADAGDWDVSFPKIGATEPVSSGNFATSAVCQPCHSASETSNAMRDAAGRNVSPYDLWKSSMKANSARDPYWRAVLSAELQRFPGATEVIAEKCTRCHTPMAAYQAKQSGLPATKLADIGTDTSLGQLAADGVSCTLCHRITSEGLGTPESFVGGFQLTGGKTVFGQHDDLFTMPMLNQSGFTPQKASHLRSSALCGSCHTVITNAFDSKGNPSETKFYEQTPYLEWRNSVYSTENGELGENSKECFGCHVPETDVDGQEIVTKVARRPDGGDFPPLYDRDSYGRHIFVGGNTLIVAMLRDHRDHLNPGVPKEAFDATIALARKQLSEETATLEWVDVNISQDLLSLDVKLINRTGHKLPTAYPSRRVFLRLEVTSPAGAVLVSSGQTDEQGRLVGKTGSPLPSELVGGPTLAHGDIIADVETPPVWETVMGDLDGNTTFSLLSAASFLKDNRILPSGWSGGHPDAKPILPVGTQDDLDFGGGEDTVHYRLPLTAPLPKGARITVTALYQVIAPRHIAELLNVKTPETVAFGDAWHRADRSPELIATIEYMVE